MITPSDLARIPPRESFSGPRLGPVTATVLEAAGHLRWAVHLRRPEGPAVLDGSLKEPTDLDRFVQLLRHHNPEGCLVAVLDPGLEKVLAGRVDVEHTGDEEAARDIRERMWPWPELTPVTIRICADASVRSSRPGAGIGWVVDPGIDHVDPVVGNQFLEGALSPAEAELGAILRGIGAVPQMLHELRFTHPARVDGVTISSDSRSALHVMRRLRNGWRVDGPCSARFAAEIQVAGQQLNGLKVRTEWVKGHAGEPMNETADRLAVAARRNVECGTTKEVQGQMRARALDDYLGSRPAAADQSRSTRTVSSTGSAAPRT